MFRHPEDTRELCQEAFLRVHRHLHQYRFDAPLKSWIAQVAYSVALRHLERRRIPLAEAVDGDGLSLAEMVADGHDVHAAVADDQANRTLHAAIESLPPLQRTRLTLYHLEELLITVITRITGIRSAKRRYGTRGATGLETRGSRTATKKK